MSTNVTPEYAQEVQFLVGSITNHLPPENSGLTLATAIYGTYAPIAMRGSYYGASVRIVLTWSVNGADQTEGTQNTEHATLVVLDERDACTRAQGASQKARWLARAVDAELRRKLAEHPEIMMKNAAGTGLSSTGGTLTERQVEELLAKHDVDPSAFVVRYEAQPLPSPTEPEEAQTLGAKDLNSGTDKMNEASAMTSVQTTTAKAPEPVQGQDRVKAIIELGIGRDASILLEGPTGCGKTSIVHELAHKHGKIYTRMNLNGQTGIEELVGRWLIKDGRTFWQDGILLTAMREGHWFLCDELNAALPETLFVLQSLLDDDRSVRVVERDGSVVRPHPDFRFFAAINPSDEYAGTKELNPSLKGRFGLYVRMEYPTPSCETQIVASRADIARDVAYSMVEVALRARSAKKQGLVYGTVSTRDLIHWGTLFGDLMERSELLELGKARPTLREQTLSAFALSSEFTLLARHKEDRDFISKAMMDVERDLSQILTGKKQSPLNLLDEAEQLMREAGLAIARAQDEEQRVQALLAEANRRMYAAQQKEEATQQREAAMKDLVAKKVTEMLDLQLGQAALVSLPPVAVEEAESERDTSVAPPMIVY